MKLRKFFIACLISSITVVASAQVGIGTTEPEATLHVEGNVIIREADIAGSKDQQLFWNPETGEVQVADKVKYPIYIVSFMVGASYYDGSSPSDYIKKFDTGIPKDRFEVSLLSIFPTFNIRYDSKYWWPNQSRHFTPRFYQYTYKGTGYKSNYLGETTNTPYPARLGIGHINNSGEITGAYKYLSTENIADSSSDLITKEHKDVKLGNLLDPVVRTKVYSDGTSPNWLLTADYLEAAPPGGGTNDWWIVFTWHIKLLVVDKGYARTIEVPEVTLDGKNTGGFDINPIVK